MSFDIGSFQVAGDEPGKSKPEIRNPRNAEDYKVLSGMSCDGVGVSRLGSSKDYLVSPAILAKLVAKEDQRRVNLQLFALRNGFILSIFDPNRSKMGKAIKAAGDRWSKHQFVHGKEKGYEVVELPEQHPEPQKSSDSLSEFIETHFPDRIVDHEDHPALRKYLDGRR